MVSPSRTSGGNTYGCVIPPVLITLRKGAVLVSTFHRDGNDANLGLIFANMPFGLPLTQVNPYEAIALTDVELIRFNQVEVEESPALAQEILLQLNRRLQLMEALLAAISHRYVKERLQKLLLLLTVEVGEVTPNGIRIGVRLTHQQLGDFVGATRVTASRILVMLRRGGWLSFDRTCHFVIHKSAVSNERRPVGEHR